MEQALLNSKRLRSIELLIVFCIALLPLIVDSLFYLLNEFPSFDKNFRILQLIYGIITECGSIALLLYVLFRQGRNISELGFSFRIKDIGISIVLFVVGYLATVIIYLIIHYIHYFFTDEILQQSYVKTILDGRINILTILFVIVNPFFEELIARAFIITEIEYLINSLSRAVFYSIFIQTTYHLYQGIPNALSLSGIFIVYSIYYSKYRRILPVILAHGYTDFFALFYANS